MLELYKNIKKLRIQLNMSQEDLAEKTGYKSISSIAKIEKGIVDLPISKIILFAKSLNTTPSDLMGWNDECKIVTNKETNPLIQIYNSLNNEGQEILISNAEFLNSQDKYKKGDTLPEQEIS